VLLPIHEQLLQELLECAATRDEEFCIGECFLKIIPFLKLYIDYENANHRSTITLNHCMANSRQLRSILRVREAASLLHLFAPSRSLVLSALLVVVVVVVRNNKCFPSRMDSICSRTSSRQSNESLAMYVCE